MKKKIIIGLVSICVVVLFMIVIQSKEDKGYENYKTLVLSDKGYKIKLPKDYEIKQGTLNTLFMATSKDKKKYLTIQRRYTPTLNELSANEYYNEVVGKIKSDKNFQGVVLEENEIIIDGFKAKQGVIRFSGYNSNGKYRKQIKTIIRTKKTIIDIGFITQEEDFNSNLEEFKKITNSFKEL